MGRSIGEWLRGEAQAGTHNARFVLGLTGIRALAAMMVLLHHLFAVAVPRVLSISIGDWTFEYHFLLTCGWMGANVFFVLSGFLLALPYVQRAHDESPHIGASGFIARRIRRVVPAYWIQIAILVTIAQWGAGWPDWKMIGLHLVFLQNLWKDTAFAINGVFWTLPAEFGFYLMLPLLAALAYRFFPRATRGWVAIALLLVAFAVIWRYLSFQSVKAQPIGDRVFAMLQLGGLIDHFAIGILFAVAYVESERAGHPITGRGADLLTALGLLGMVAMMATLHAVFDVYWDGHPLLFFGYTLNAIFMGTFILGTAGGGRVSQWLFANPLSVGIGIVSYSLYLWHFPVILWINRLLDAQGVTGDRLPWLVALAIPASLGVALLSYLVSERPFMHRRIARPS